MKNLLITIATLLCILCTYTAEGQGIKKRRQTKKNVVHKKKVTRKGTVRNRKVGKANIGKRNRTYTVTTTRKRVKRTTIVCHHYRNLPKRGATISTIHAKAQTIKFRNTNFRFHLGVWYKPHGVKWFVARPNNGIKIRILPVGYRTIVLRSNTYYYYYGTYYQQKGEEYEVIEAPIHAEIDSLPQGYTTTTIDGNEYYELDSIYYMPSINEDGEEILVVVENPTS